ncbi:chaplin [Actinomadura logoneensis]|uniref:Chaplin n=1 Tax=Actinomadura logoneensis TaxID=2293572 RepID=A0A372JFZ6_9ACTN|nr:chaplin [Actinomadura logoneensis]RFU38829.1 chaplin [Actinomadura logoneensis]
MFKRLALTGALCAAVSASVLAVPANADIRTDGSGGVLSGNQIIAPISIPIDVCGNAVSVLGIAGGGCKGGAAVGNAIG